MRILAMAPCALVLVLGGCRKEAAPPARPALTAVNIMVVPNGGGSAHFEVRSDGKTTGAHLSGDATPFVHQDTGSVSSAARDSLWALVSALDSATANASPPSGKGYAALQLSFANGSAWLTSWPDSATATDPRVRAAAAWLMVHRIGGW